MRLLLAFLAVLQLVRAQFSPGGPTQPGLPEGCLGSFPNTAVCAAANWNIPNNDPCRPSQIPLPGQQVYIKDAVNFCINMPDPQSIFLQQQHYSANKLPTFVQGEGYVRARCMGDYLPTGALRITPGAIRSAHVKKYANYVQISGVIDCETMGINCTQSRPGVYDDGGQYDNVAYTSCGKEPYSGVDATQHPGFVNYVEIGGNSVFCMRVCAEGTQAAGGVCDVRNDTAGCEGFMGVVFNEPDGAFVYEDVVAGTTQTFSVSLPPVKAKTTTTTTTTTTTAAATTAAAASSAGAAVTTVAPTDSKATATSARSDGGRASTAFGLAFLAGFLLM
ncbi:hypothetical protein CcCBS67573_g04069 [Chytriomyces confervae]|uniref:Uncharacterized protein n=1 Tax=Chytriomyces confervae TaxID=246404 RepID=A0A507FE83_9FUNG|nr:hypothetical protein CcCBS67573_g04069 [Chytriomyces confervae]